MNRHDNYIGATAINKKRYIEKSNLSDYNFGRLKKIRNLLPEEGKLLELGAWDGTTIKFYKQKFKGKTYGIDISKENFKYAIKYFDKLKECDLNYDKIPFKSNFFDVVICGEVIEHIYDTDQLLIEIHRVLKPNGILIITTPNLASFLNRIFLLFGLQPLSTEVSSRYSQYGNRLRRNLVPAGHIRNFTYASLNDILKHNKFKIKKRLSANIGKSALIRFIEDISGYITPALGSDIIFHCEAIKN